MTTESRIIVQLRPDVWLPYQDGAQAMLPPELAAAWQALAAAFPDMPLSLDRLLRTCDETQLDQLLAAAANASGEAPPPLRNLMAIDVSALPDRQALLNALRALPFIGLAYEESPLTQPAVNPSDDPLAPLQIYLGAAPFGVEVFQAWSHPGSDGAGVRFVDIERGWDLSHEDLAGAGVVPLNASVPGNEQHSTSCLGIVLAQDNDKGVIGLAPAVRAAIASSLRPSLADALVLAVGFLGAGDVLLIEEQSIWNIPVETDPHLAQLIRVMTMLGITVIEPAGNGGHDLDLVLRPDGTSLDRSTPMFFDSGAIVVGARNALVNRGRLPVSSFGSRVDCHAWGELIVTTGAAPGPRYIGINPLFGDLGMGGTSGASAIIAGVAIVLQGVARARGRPLMPAAMRAMLADASFNTASDNPALDRIGVMPNLAEMIARL